MEEFAKNPPPPAPTVSVDRGLSLVERLCAGKHLVEVRLRPEKNVKLFKEALDRDYVHVKFTETKGGTELGFRVDRRSSDLSAADFERGNGTAHIEGSLTLDYVKVNCVADIDLTTLSGTGCLVRAEGD
jgi:hypothetical protein